MPPPMTLQAYLEGLDPQTRAAMDALRQVVAGSHGDLAEEIKWNAPSFAHAGEDRVTLGLERSGGLRVVLHRGAKPKDLAGFRFEDGSGLAKWPAADRGVITLRDQADVEVKAPALRDLIQRWIVANA